MNKLQLIKLTDLQNHPQNPRLIMRDDVVEGIAANVGKEWQQKHALSVRPFNGGYQILSGHHRRIAAEKAGITEVWCWVEEMDDEAAFMELATSNNQGELSPLEIGMHALHYVEKSAGGRGKKGGLSAYAEKVGKNRGNVLSYRDAAQVAKVFNDKHLLLAKAAHLAAIHKLPQLCWQSAVKLMLNGDWSAAETADRIREASKSTTEKRILGLLAGKTSKNELDRIDDLVSRVAEDLKGADDALCDEWVKWASQEDPIDIKQVQNKRIYYEDKASEITAYTPPERANLVLADPPWQYDFAESDSRQIENQYPSASVDEICGMAPDTEDDAILLLWATAPKLEEALKVMDAWGFAYKTQAVWDKEKIGMGYWFRGQHEILIVATKGEASPPDARHRVSSVFREPRGKHSKKPECVYSWIELAFPSHKKLEMFCREPRPGWDTFGNESKTKAS